MSWFRQIYARALIVPRKYMGSTRVRHRRRRRRRRHRAKSRKCRRRRQRDRWSQQFRTALLKRCQIKLIVCVCVCNDCLDRLPSHLVTILECLTLSINTFTGGLSVVFHGFLFPRHSAPPKMTLLC